MFKFFFYFRVKISSPNRIQVIEFRDKDGTSFHHLEFLECSGCSTVDLTKFDILNNIPNDLKEVLFIVEDSTGNILKSKLDTEQLIEKKDGNGFSPL